MTRDLTGIIDLHQRISSWRSRAESLRAIASTMTVSPARGNLLDWADHWDRLAARAKEQDPNGSSVQIFHAVIRDFKTVFGSAMGNIQLLDPKTNTLTIVGQTGFDQEFLETFAEVNAQSGCACGRALRDARPIFIPDTEADEEFAPYRDAARKANYRSVISVPLRYGTRAPVGVISAHFCDPTQMSETSVISAQKYASIVTEALYGAIG